MDEEEEEDEDNGSTFSHNHLIVFQFVQTLRRRFRYGCDSDRKVNLVGKYKFVAASRIINIRGRLKMSRRSGTRNVEIGWRGRGPCQAPETDGCRNMLTTCADLGLSLKCLH